MQQLTVQTLFTDDENIAVGWQNSLYSGKTFEYLLEELKDNRMLIICADSTGHGVPGALLSMVGITLIKDLSHRENITSPGHLLNELDKEINISLNQNIVSHNIQDGMDISIALVDFKKNELIISSAMNPFIIQKGNKQIYMKGSKFSVGGDCLTGDKFFDNQYFKFEKGDKFYLFSDGYEDQFGGSKGKKYKIRYLKETLKQISTLSMNQQHEYLLQEFNDWKGNYEQVDDVCLIGIEL